MPQPPGTGTVRGGVEVAALARLVPLVTPVLALGEAGPVTHELPVPALAAVLALVAQAVCPTPALGAGGAAGAAGLARHTDQDQGGQEKVAGGAGGAAGLARHTSQEQGGQKEAGGAAGLA